MGQAEEQEDQQETGAGGTPVRRDQAGVQRGACAGDDITPGAREDGVRVFLLQLGTVGHAGREVVAWAIGVSRERDEGWWRTW